MPADRRRSLLPAVVLRCGAALWILPAFGCGPSVDVPGDREAEQDFPEDTVRDVVISSEGGVCILEGQTADGQHHRLECRVDPDECVWFTDDSERLTCDEPDWANTCPNGVPVCVEWVSHIDFANAEVE